MTLTITQGNDSNAIDEIVDAINNGGGGGNSGWFFMDTLPENSLGEDGNYAFGVLMQDDAANVAIIKKESGQWQFGSAIVLLTYADKTIVNALDYSLNREINGNTYSLGVNTSIGFITPTETPTNTVSLVEMANKINKNTQRSIQFLATTTEAEFTIPDGYGYFSGCVIALTGNATGTQFSMKIKKPENSDNKKLLVKRESQSMGETSIYVKNGNLNEYEDIGLTARFDDGGAECFSTIILSDVNDTYGNGAGCRIDVFAAMYNSTTVRAHFMIHPINPPLV